MLLLVAGCSEAAKPVADEHPKDTVDSRHIGDSVVAVVATPDTVPAPKADSSDGLQVLSGKFIEVVEGDYMHFEMSDASGKRWSFFTAKELPVDEFEPFLVDPKKKGRKVQVTWRKVRRYFPEGSGEMDVEEVVSIKELK